MFITHKRDYMPSISEMRSDQRAVHVVWSHATAKDVTWADSSSREDVRSGNTVSQDAVGRAYDHCNVYKRLAGRVKTIRGAVR